VDEVCQKDASKKHKQLRLTKGAHVVIDQSLFPLRQSVYFDTPDGRMVFAIPRDGKTYVGTTDTFYHEDPATPKVHGVDRDYLLHAIHFMFPEINIQEKPIESSWAGVRPLIYAEGKNPSEISRKDEIWEGETGLITIAGGKLTGYRKMAESVVDLIAKRLQDKGHKYQGCQTRKYPISGGDVGGSRGFPIFLAKKEIEATNYGFTREEGFYLAQLYGSNVDELFRYGQQYGQAREIKLPRILYVQLMYAIEHEMAVKPVDFFIRRTGALFFNIYWVHKWKEEVVGFMAKKLNWTKKERVDYEAQLDQELREAARG
jgi:glycerol-3-phosphate dehydrogenase